MSRLQKIDDLFYSSPVKISVKHVNDMNDPMSLTKIVLLPMDLA